MSTTTVTLSYASDSYTLTVALSSSPVTVAVQAAGDAYQLAVALSSSPVTVAVQAARDAYQLAVADGYAGTRAEWLASLQGEDGPTPVVITLAAYLALTAPQQVDPTKWYVIPKAT